MAWTRILGAGAAIIVVGVAAAWFLTKPAPLPDTVWSGLGKADLARGEMLFWAGGCTGCHAAKGASGEEVMVMSGGLSLSSPFGTFNVPNISPHREAGIGDWTLAEFGNAMLRGVGRKGEHLYPAFPYPSYARMSPADRSAAHTSELQSLMRNSNA